MAPPQRHKLKLTKLDFLSLVDTPAQETATFRLIKRKGADDELQAAITARIVKFPATDSESPLVHCWAFTCTDENGAPYHDLQGDAITEYIKAAEEFFAAGGAVDEMHDGKQTNRLAWAYPMDSDIARAQFGDAIGKQIKTSGLMVAIRPTADALAKIRSGEYTGVSIAGLGTRETIDGLLDLQDHTKAAKSKCADCGAYTTADATKCAGCGMEKRKRRRPGATVGVPSVPPEVGGGAAAEPVGKATWTTADIDSLPDSSFLYVEPGGKKDDGGKTTPRSLRHFPYRDADGKVDLPHLRDAVARIPQSSLDATLRDKLQAKAEKLLGKQHEKRVRKDAVLTNVVDGHQHSIDLDDPADSWRDMLSTSYQNATGSTSGHSHAWTYDETTGKITIALDSGHNHTVDAVVPADVLAEAAEMDDPKCAACGTECDEDDSFCPHCGARLDNDAVPSPVTDDPSSGATIVIVSARNSPPAGATPTVKQDPKEHTPMATEKEQISELEKRAARFEKMSTLTDAARVHFVKLNGNEADAFLSKSPAEREHVLSEIEKANEVVYTSTVDGRLYRKNDDIRLIEFAKRIDDTTAKMQAAEATARDATFAKRGEEVLKNFPVGAKKDLRGRIMKALNSEFTVPAEYEEAVNAMKGMDNAFGELGRPRGHDGGGMSAEEGSPVAKLNALVLKYQSDHKLPSFDAALLQASERDPEIRKAYEAIAS